MKRIQITGVPMDLGAGRRGVDMGPSALRLAKLSDTLKALGHEVEDAGNIYVRVAESIQGNGALPYAEAIAETCRQLFRQLQACSDDTFPIILGGDHSVSLGSVSGVAKGKRLGVLWIDAHTDINTPATSPSGNVHGMPVAHLLGYGDQRFLDIWGGGAVLQAQDIVYIGIRSVDDEEKRLLSELGIKTFTMKDVDRLGIACIVEQSLAYLHHTDSLHVSFDADSLEPTVAPGVGTPVPGGLSYREAHLLMELLADSGRVSSLDLVEVNPILDTQNRTANVMVELTASLLGKQIV